MEFTEDKTFFLPGDIVLVRLDIDNKPKMIVVRKESSIIKTKEGKDVLKGIRCRWFTDTKELQEAIFNTKDLIKL